MRKRMVKGMVKRRPRHKPRRHRDDEMDDLKDMLAICRRNFVLIAKNGGLPARNVRQLRNLIADLQKLVPEGECAYRMAMMGY